jgi:hypothetical protein
MSLISCPECNSEISDQASNCPHCGFPLHGVDDEPVASTDKKYSYVTKSLIITGVFVIVYFIALNWAWSAYKSELRSAFTQYDINKSVGYAKAIRQVKRSGAAKIYKFLAYPIARSSVNSNGGELPIWGALVQSLMWGLLVLWQVYRYLKLKSELNELGIE